MLQHFGCLCDEIGLIFDGGSVSIQLSAGQSSITLKIGEAEHSPETLLRMWKRMSREWNDPDVTSQPERDELLRKSKAWKKRDETLAELSQAGFIRTNLDESERGIMAFAI